MCKSTYFGHRTASNYVRRFIGFQLVTLENMTCLITKYPVLFHLVNQFSFLICMDYLIFIFL